MVEHSINYFELLCRCILGFLGRYSDLVDANKIISQMLNSYTYDQCANLDNAPFGVMVRFNPGTVSSPETNSYGNSLKFGHYLNDTYGYNWIWQVTFSTSAGENNVYLRKKINTQSWSTWSLL